MAATTTGLIISLAVILASYAASAQFDHRQQRDTITDMLTHRLDFFDKDKGDSGGGGYGMGGGGYGGGGYGMGGGGYGGGGYGGGGGGGGYGGGGYGGGNYFINIYKFKCFGRINTNSKLIILIFSRHDVL